MELLVEQVRAILNGSPTRSMPLSQLMKSLPASGVRLDGGADRVVQHLTEHSDQFRVIPDRLGPWTHWPAEHGGRPPGHDPQGDPWILAGPQSTPERGASQCLLDRLRDTLMAWGWEVDEGSQVGIARWLQANREAGLALNELLSPPGSSSRKHPSTTPPPDLPPGRRILQRRRSAGSRPADHPGRR